MQHLCVDAAGRGTLGSSSLTANSRFSAPSGAEHVSTDATPADHSARPGVPRETDTRPAASPLDLQPLPLDLVSPQLTLRALATGMLLGGVLSICNIYAGLKVGLVFNMAIPAALLGFEFMRLSGPLPMRGFLQGRLT